MNMEQNKKEKNQLVRCSDCRAEFSGCSIKEILSNARCGNNGGKITDACKTTLRTEGKNIFRVIPVDLSKPKKKIEVTDE